MKNTSPYDTHLYIKQIREELGLTSKFVADTLDMHYSNYTLLEQGKQNIRLETIVSFWNLISRMGYNISLETLITGVERKGFPARKRVDKLHTKQ